MTMPAAAASAAAPETTPPPRRLSLDERLKQRSASDVSLAKSNLLEAVSAVDASLAQSKAPAERMVDVEATPLEGSFVINIGDMMQRWTNNVYSSTVHRVVDNAAGLKRRFSIPFFFNANCDALVKCLPTCCSEDRPALFEPDTAEKILQDRYAGAFGANKA